MKRIGIVIVVFLWVCSFSSTGKGVVEFSETRYFFGTIEETNGPVNHVFMFKNVGTTPVRILNIQSSCGCTTSDYTSTPVAPGGTGYVKGIFDPKNRPGQFSRTLTVITDGSPETHVLYMEGTVGSMELELKALFPREDGNIRMSVKELNFVKVKENGRDSILFSILNNMDKVLIIRAISNPSVMSSSVQDVAIAPKSSESFWFRYHGHMAGKLGPKVDSVFLQTNDPINPRKLILVNANVVQDFDKLTEKERANAPVWKVSEKKVTVPDVYQGEDAIANIPVSNEGKSPLVIKGVYSKCNCVEASLAKGKLKKGQGFLTLKMSTKKRHRNVTEKVTVITNDPNHSEETFTIQTRVVIPGVDPVTQ